MIPLTVEQVCDLVVRSRLHTPEALQAVVRRWQTVALEPADVNNFMSWLVDRKHLTPYQARLLGEGKPGSLFLDDYKILDRIGSGRSAGVFQAQRGQEPVVALKVLPPSKARDPQVLARFHREARLAMQLNNPCLVRTLGAGEGRGVPYLVMEYLEGITLHDLLQQRRLHPKEGARLGLLTALGLQHLHEKGLVHRDLKPANLMLCPGPGPQENTMTCAIKILDIGLGRELFDPEDRKARNELTNEDAVLGTAAYMAPEQARDPRRVDIRADLYSLGCTLYHALAGRPPFVADSVVAQILRHATQAPQPLETMRPPIPAGLSQIVATLLAKDPEQRFRTPVEAADAFRAYLAAQPRTP